MRLYEISHADVESAVSPALLADIDERGNLRLTGLDCDDHAIIVVVADDDSDFVITTFPDD